MMTYDTTSRHEFFKKTSSKNEQAYIILYICNKKVSFFTQTHSAIKNKPEGTTRGINAVKTK